MPNVDRSSLYIALFLIGLGVVFLALTLIPQAAMFYSWPMIFFLIAGGFFLPSIVWPEVRHELAGLFIPGAVMLALGVIFTYNTITQDWAVWAYGWLLIPAGVGLGLLLASMVGRWSSGAFWAGVWMLVISIGLFSLFGIVFGAPIVKTAGPLLLIGSGILLLLRNLVHYRGE